MLLFRCVRIRPSGYHNLNPTAPSQSNPFSHHPAGRVPYSADGKISANDGNDGTRDHSSALLRGPLRRRYEVASNHGQCGLASIEAATRLSS